MSEPVLIAIIGLIGSNLIAVIAWLRERRKDRLTEEEIEERINKSRLETIATLQTQLGTATEASGNLRKELDRAHGDIEKMQTEITGLHQQIAANAETIASLSEVNAQLMIEKREAMNEKAQWQKKYLEAITEREAFIELLHAVKEKAELVGPLRDKVEAMERRLTAVQNDTGRLKQKVGSAA